MGERGAAGEGAAAGPDKEPPRRKPKDPFAEDPFADVEVKAAPAELDHDPFADAAPKTTKAGERTSGRSRKRKQKPKDPFADDPFADVEGEVEVAPAELKEDPFSAAALAKSKSKGSPSKGSSSKGSASPKGSSSKGSSSKGSPSKGSPSKGPSGSKGSASSKGSSGSKGSASSKGSSGSKKPRDPFADDPFAGAEVEAAPAELESDPFAGVRVKVEARRPSAEPESHSEAEGGKSDAEGGKSKPEGASSDAKGTTSDAKGASAGGKSKPERTGPNPPGARSEAEDGKPNPQGARSNAEDGKPSTQRARSEAEDGKPNPQGARSNAEDGKPEPEGARADAEGARSDAAGGEPEGARSGAEEARSEAKDASSEEVSSGAKEGEPEPEGARGEAPAEAGSKRAKPGPKRAKPAAKVEGREAEAASQPKPAGPKSARAESKAEAESDSERLKVKASAKPAGSGEAEEGVQEGQVRVRAKQRGEGAKPESKPKIALPAPAQVIADSRDSSIAEEPPPPPPSRRGLSAALGLLGLAVAGGLLFVGNDVLERGEDRARLAQFLKDTEEASLEDALYMRGQLPERLRERAEVLERIEEARAAKRRSETEEEVARSLAQLDPSGALEAWEKRCEEALRKSPGSIAARVGLLRAQRIRGLQEAQPGTPPRKSLKAALALAAEASSLAPEDARVALARGQLLLLAGSREGAEQSFALAIEEGGVTRAARVARGERGLLARDWVTADVEFDSALSLVPGGRALWGRGRARLRAGNPKDALEDARRAVELDPYLFEAHLLIAESLIASEGAQREEVEAALSATLKLHPNEPRALALRAIQSLGRDPERLEREKAALTELSAKARRSLDLGETPEAWAVIAVWAWSSDREKEAERAIAAGLELDPTGAADYWLHLTRARISYVAGRADGQLLGDLDHALSHEPRSVFVRTLRSQVRHRAGDLVGACEDVAWAIDLAPERHGLRLLRARWLCAADPPQLGQAIQDYRAYLEASPDDTSALVERAAAYHRAELYEAAYADLLAARQAKVQLRAPLGDRIAADYHYTRGEWQQALEAYKQVLAAQPEGDERVQQRISECERYLRGSLRRL